LSEQPAISEEMQSLVNVEFGPEVYEIEKGMLRKFAEAIDDPNPRWLEIAPPTFASAILPNVLINKLLAAKSPLNRFLNGSNELEYYKPIKAGDTISVFSKLSRLREMKNKDGSSLFMILDVTYKNQDGEVVATGKYNYIRY
jgi:acyl dehydratase